MIESRPLVSAVIATYNMACYLPLAVRSALNQSYQPLEVVVVDDGSSDDTVEAIAPFRDDPRVRYLRQPNHGQAVAKNRGVSEARGDFLAFLDADDYWRQDKLALQMPLFEGAPGTGVVYARMRHIDEVGRDLGVTTYPLHRGRISGELLISNFVGFGTSVVRRECFDRLGGFDESLRMGIDYDLWLRLSAQYDFDYVDEPLLLYRQWSGQMSRDGRSRYLAGIATMERFLHGHPDSVPRSIADEAWAHTYVGFGWCVREAGESYRASLPLFLRALRHRVTYLPAWRAIAVSLLPPAWRGIR